MSFNTHVFISYAHADNLKAGAPGWVTRFHELLGGAEPQAPSSKPKGGDQINLTDEESRIMPGSSGGFGQSYNAQAGVDTETMLVVTAHVT